MQSDDVSGNNVDNPETVNWDPNFTELAKKAVAPVGKRWFRSEVRGPDSVPRTGGGLVVCNHSGGGLTPDVLVFAPAFSDKSCASRGTWVPWSGARSQGFQYVWYVRPFASCRAAT